MLLTSLFVGYSQSWYPIDAKWIFNNQELVFFKAHGINEYTVIGDTVVQGTDSRKISQIVTNYKGTVLRQDTICIYEENSHVYFWNGVDFDLMYDFSLKAGDTLDVQIDTQGCDSVSLITIDSVSILQHGDISLMVQYSSYNVYAEGIMGYNYTVNNKLIEKIGDENGFIFAPKCYIAEQFLYDGLRCYTDHEISYVSTSWKNFFSDISCDSIINDSTTALNSANIEPMSIVPNPSRDFIEIKCNDLIIEECLLEIIDLRGNRKTVVPNLTVINIKRYPVGMYFLRIIKDHQLITTLKFVKN